MGKGRPNWQAGGTGEEGGAFGSLLGQPAFWAVVGSFIKRCWQLLRVQPAAGFMRKCPAEVCRKERGWEESKREGMEEQKEQRRGQRKREGRDR